MGYFCEEIFLQGSAAYQDKTFLSTYLSFTDEFRFGSEKVTGFTSAVYDELC